MGTKNGRPPVKVKRPRRSTVWQTPGRWHYSILSFKKQPPFFIDFLVIFQLGKGIEWMTANAKTP
jgi:hypothetical protein